MAAVINIRRTQGPVRFADGHGGLKRTGPMSVLGLLLLMGWLTLSGCGVKGPPVPLHKAPPLPEVTDLTHRLADHQVTLTWRLTAALDDQAARQASFIVRRSRWPVDQPDCENCPLVFATVGTVPYVETDEKTHALTLSIETGYRYVFTVYLEINGVVGQDSKPVRFDYPSDQSVVPAEAP